MMNYWECGSVGAHLPSICEADSSILSARVCAQLKNILVAGKTALVLAEDPKLIPSTHAASHNCNSSFGGPGPDGLF